jgi:hypothetical protein
MVATRRGKTRSTSGTLYTAKNLARTLQKKRKAAAKKTTSARATTSRATTRRTTTSAPRRATTSTPRRATTSRATTSTPRRATTSAPRRAAAPSAARRALATGRGTFVRRTGSRSASLAGMFAAMRARGDYDENRARGLRGRR